MYEFAPSALATAPGITGSSEGRPRPVPVIRYFSCLIRKEQVPISIHLKEKIIMKHYVPENVTNGTISPSQEPYLTNPVSTTQKRPGKLVPIPLVFLCYGRSGDKGDTSNIGLIARKSEYYEFIKNTITEEVVHNYFSHLISGGKVTRYEVPGISGFNFVITKSLGTGGVSSLRMDRQGKAYAQMLLGIIVKVPFEWTLNLQSKL